MSLTNPQIWLLKSAVRQAGLDDAEYRSTLAQLCGVNTSKDPALTDDHLDMLMSYLESVYWRGVRSGVLQPPCKRSEPFQKPGYWATKNKAGNTSRDRYSRTHLAEQICEAESTLTGMGFDARYCEAIRAKVCGSRVNIPALQNYLAALLRTITSKRRRHGTAKAGLNAQTGRWQRS